MSVYLPYSITSHLNITNLICIESRSSVYSLSIIRLENNDKNKSNMTVNMAAKIKSCRHRNQR